MTYKILVKHFYQDTDNPHIQEILDNGEFYMRYALFKALIDSGKSFEIQPVSGMFFKQEEGEKHEHTM